MKISITFPSFRKIALRVALTGALMTTATQAGNDFIARHGLIGAEYQELAVDLNDAGWQLDRVSGYEHNGSTRFAALWLKENGPVQAARHGLTGAEYQEAAEDFDDLGYQLVWVDGYNVGNKLRFAAIWEKVNGPPLRARHGMTSAEYQTEFLDNKADGYRCVHVDGYRSNGSDRYAAIWLKDGGTFPRAHHGHSPEDYQQAVEDNFAEGFRPVQISAWGAGNSAKFASLWVKTGGQPLWMRHHMNGQQYQAEVENFHYTGYRLRQVCGYSVQGEGRFLGVWENPHMQGNDLNLIENRINNYMDDQGIPGLTVAIAKDGNLVYARGFGWADMENAKLVSPTTRMRIASISKPLTSVAIMRLVDSGDLSLDDRVFGPAGILGNDYGNIDYTQNLLDIRVRHLLWHASGFTNVIGQDNEGEDVTDDPMFNNHPNHTDLIDWMLDNRQPAVAPLNLSEYSNFGYCLLGRIIEEVSGKSYENYVRDHVLKQCGVTEMEIGNRQKEDRLPKEAIYYPGNNPYTVIRPQHFDSHGGWIATASDLLRFMVRTDGLASKPDIIQPGTYTDMLTASPIDGIRAMGWRFGSNGYGHNGCMSGTIGFLWNTDDGYSFAIVANTRPEDDGCAWTARSMMLDIIEDVREWPDYDLFTGTHCPVERGPSGGKDIIVQPPSSVPAPPRFPSCCDGRTPPKTATLLPHLSTIPTDPNPVPELKLKLTRENTRRGALLNLTFDTDPEWEHFLEESADMKRWTSRPIPGTTSGSTTIQKAASSQKQWFFRVRRQPASAGHSEDVHRYVPPAPAVRR